jgi:hypothetical protein
MSAALFFCGCEEEVYSQFCSDEKLHVNCLRIENHDENVTALLQEEFLHVKTSPECPFTLVGMHYHVKACKNPVANSLGADFDGYVRLQLFHEDACYYRIQQDFKNAPWQQKMRHIAKAFKNDLNL